MQRAFNVVEKPSATSSVDSELDGFLPEGGEPPQQPTGGSRVPLIGAGLAGLVVLAGIGWFVSARAGAADTAALRIESAPAAAVVTVDGVQRGSTPLDVTLPSGPHKVLLTQGSRTQQLDVTLTRGGSVVHHITWPVEVAAAPTVGSLAVASEPSGLRFTVDGVERGSTPATLADLSPGSHEVVVRLPSGPRRRTVDIQAGATGSLFVGGDAATSVSPGWLAVKTAAPLQIREGGKLVGSTESDRIMLAAGDHTFEFSNADLGFSVTRGVRINAGGTAQVSLDLPQAPLSVNAVPWAQVSVDGRALGDTPIGNSMETIGRHELVFRHPELGERRASVLVTLKGPARVSVDMRKP